MVVVVSRFTVANGTDGASRGETAADLAPVLEHLLTTGHTAHVLVAVPDGTIRWANPAMAAALGVAAGELAGRPAWDLLTDPDAARLRDRVARADRNGEEPFLVNFVDARHSPFTLECRCDVRPGYFVLLGEPPRDRTEGFREEWLRTNNELAALARENARQAKELAAARGELERALAELRDSHWHLKKLQEVLPICMDCGKVKAGARWEGVVEYLKKNALFLSHGYCPDCLARKAAEWGIPPEDLPA